LKAGPRRREAG